MLLLGYGMVYYGRPIE